jgi:hypothetical protein
MEITRGISLMNYALRLQNSEIFVFEIYTFYSPGALLPVILPRGHCAATFLFFFTFYLYGIFLIFE